MIIINDLYKLSLAMCIELDTRSWYDGSVYCIRNKGILTELDIKNMFTFNLLSKVQGFLSFLSNLFVRIIYVQHGHMDTLSLLEAPCVQLCVSPWIISNDNAR